MAVTVATRTPASVRAGWDAKVLSLDVGGAGVDYVAQFRSAKLTMGAATVEYTASGDVWEYHVPKRKNWSLEMTIEQQADVTLTAFIARISTTEGPAVVSVNLTPSGGSVGGRTAQTTCPSWAGNGVVESVDYDIPSDGPQTITIRIKGQGLLTQTNVA